MAKTKTDPTKQPAYEGEDGSKQGKKKLLCQRCDRLATHRALIFTNHNGDSALPVDIYLCEGHVKQEMHISDLRRVKELPEFRRYLKKYQAWLTLQGSGEQLMFDTTDREITVLLPNEIPTEPPTEMESFNGTNP